MDVACNWPGNIFPNCWQPFDSWQTPEYCTHDFWNPVSFPGAIRDSLFIFNAEELEIKEDGPFEQPAR